tara:strand:- start:1376 stop:2131 length:756 start_codon:yes stop_codon:yes gene_type:complete
MKIDLRKGECLEVMKSIPDASVDAIITDPPYGTTDCKWDSVIAFEPMWEQLNRIIKPNGAIVLFGSEPFSSALRMSNVKNYKYDWIWKKNRGSNFALVKYQPMKEHEIVSVFSNKTHNYYPIKQKRRGKGLERIKGNYNISKASKIATGIKQTITTTQGQELRQPSSIQKFNTTEKGIKREHPTQKPILLMEYLIKTYTIKGETVLDFTMGSGTTGVACLNTKRNFIGIEQDNKYFEIAKKRIGQAQLKLF